MNNYQSLIDIKRNSHYDAFCIIKNNPSLEIDKSYDKMLSKVPYYSLNQILLQIKRNHFLKTHHLNVNMIQMIRDDRLLKQLSLSKIDVNNEELIDSFTMTTDELMWKYLIKYHNVVAHDDGCYSDSLYKLFKHGDVNLIKFLIKYFELEKNQLIEENTAIFGLSCSRSGDLDKVKYLVKTLEIDINDIITEVLSENGHLEVVKYLIEHFKLTVDDIQSSNFLVLRLNCYSCRYDIVRYLIETFYFPLHIFTQNNHSIMTSIMRDGQYDIIRFIFDKYDLSS